jgi:hypothetical protein
MRWPESLLMVRSAQVSVMTGILLVVQGRAGPKDQ